MTRDPGADSSSSGSARYVGLAAGVAIVTATAAALMFGAGDDTTADGSSPPATIAAASAPGDSDDGGDNASDDGDGVVEEELQAVSTEAPTTVEERPVSRDLRPVAAVASSTRAAVPELRCGGSNRFDAELLIDGTLDLGWGPSADDGTGEWIQLDFGEPVVITEIGLTPGYLRVAPRQSEGCADVSAFGFNRFVNSVRYQLDDGSTFDQVFLDQPQMQWISTEPISTQYVLMEITGTSQRAGADDDTILSEIGFKGYTE